MQGLQAGGLSGYGQAGINLGALATRGLGATGAISGATASELGSALGYAAIPLSVYNFAKNWQSGSTWSDALAGASTGAAIGSVVPGIGTLIGAGLGAGIGALSSAFGGGRTSAEAYGQRGIDVSLAGATTGQRSQAFGQASPSQSIQYIQGAMSAHDQSPGHAEPIQLVWGKDNVNGFVTDMTSYIDSQIQSGKLAPNTPPQQIYQQVVAPWLASKGASINPNQYDVQGNPEGQNLIDAVTQVIGLYQMGALTAQTPVGAQGQTISGLVAYGA
jgi:hypothetical protein